jgi:UDP-N-acetylglucosamine 2-epimerase (non-hydrolysing)
MDRKDDRHVLGDCADGAENPAEGLGVVFPIHPRTLKNMARFGLDEGDPGGLHLVEPLGYLEFLRLMAEARLVLTDSGGIQEEATILKVPCLTLRENTERPVTVDVGCNQIVGTDPNRILAAYRKVVAVENFTCGTPDKWDGRAAERIADTLVSSLADIGNGRPGGRA